MTNETSIPPDDVPMSLMEHLTELRKRLFISVGAFLLAFALCYNCAETIFNWLMMPLAGAMKDAGGTNRMIYTDLSEGFLTYMKIGAFGGIILSFPVIGVQIWKFIAPALFPNEKKVILPYLIASPILFIMGAALVYEVIIPLAWRFLLGFQTGLGQTVMPIQLEARIADYLSLIMTLIVGFGICFQMPIVLFLCAKAGFIKSSSLVEYRRFAIVIIFIVAAVATPPDVISQLSLAFPLMGLYEASIIGIRKMEKNVIVDERKE